MNALIRSIGGRETPAPGRWTISTGQQVAGRVGRRFRRGQLNGRTTAGSLLIPDSGDPAFHLGFAIPHPTTPHPATPHPATPHLTSMTYQSISIAPAPRHGLWSVAGELIIDGQLTPARSLLVYHGVFRTGPGAVAWLGWYLTVPILRTHCRGGGGAIRHLTLSADLNADAPPELALDFPNNPPA